MKNTFTTVSQKEHKVLRKVKKNWVVLSVSTLALLGAGSLVSNEGTHLLPNSTICHVTALRGFHGPKLLRYQ